MTFSTQQFSYDKDRRRFIADASDLAPLGVQLFEWVPGINDTGLSVRSPRTNNVVRFMIINQRTRNGDTQYWDLVPVHQDQVAFDIEDVTMRIYND